MRKIILALIPSLGLLTASIPLQAGDGPPLSLTLLLLGFCCIFLLMIGVIVLGVAVRRENQEKKKED
jgi:hypothetical protein